MRRHRTIAGVAVAALAFGGAAAPVTLAKSKAKPKTHKASFTCKGATSTTSTTAPVNTTCFGTPFGSFKARVLVAPPNVTYTFTFKNGTMSLAGITNLTGTGITGTWKITKGTGHYAHATGKGTLTGQLKPGAPFKFDGSVKF